MLSLIPLAIVDVLNKRLTFTEYTLVKRQIEWAFWLWDWQTWEHAPFQTPFIKSSIPWTTRPPVQRVENRSVPLLFIHHRGKFYKCIPALQTLVFVLENLLHNPARRAKWAVDQSINVPHDISWNLRNGIQFQGNANLWYEIQLHSWVQLMQLLLYAKPELKHSWCCPCTISVLHYKTTQSWSQFLKKKCSCTLLLIMLQPVHMETKSSHWCVLISVSLTPYSAMKKQVQYSRKPQRHLIQSSPVHFSFTRLIPLNIINYS